MSVRESSDGLLRSPADGVGVSAFTRWRGLLSLTLGVLLGPVVALVNQTLIYSVNMWACGRGLQATMHIVPFLSVIVTLGAAYTAYRNWHDVGKGVEDEEATVASRSRFLSLLGIAISLFSTLVILAMWASVFVFDPCMRA